MTKRAVILDLDGTVADTLATIGAALNDGLAALDLPRRTLDEVAGMVGEGVVVLCRKGLPAGAEDRLDELLHEVRAAYREHPMRHCRLYDGMQDALDALRDRGVRLAVLSNKPHELTVATVEGLGVADRFDDVVGHREEVPHKPDPTSARALCARLGVEPSRVLYAGDTPIDVQTARNAGFVSIAVTWGFRPADELTACSPDHLIDSPSRIVEIYDAAAAGGA